MKKFAGIRFKNGDSWAVITSIWLTQKKTCCYWPDAGHVESLARAEKTPQPTWRMWPVKGIDVWSGKYDSATRKVTEENVATTEADTADETHQLCHTKTATYRENREISQQNDKSDSSSSNSDDEPSKMVPISLNKTSYISRENVEDTSSLEDLTAEFKIINTKMDELLTRIVQQNVILKENILLKELTEQRKNIVAPSCQTPSGCQPADTPEELEVLASSSTLFEELIQLEESTLCKTTTSMLKLLMTRRLATQHSLTGLDRNRQRVKYAFRGSLACRLMERSIAAMPRYTGVSRKSLHAAIGTSLKNSCDWEGYRGKRKKDPAVLMSEGTIVEETGNHGISNTLVTVQGAVAGVDRVSNDSSLLGGFNARQIAVTGNSEDVDEEPKILRIL